MKVLYLHQYFVPPDAPGGTRSYEFARRLVARGHEVTIVTSSAMLPCGFADPERVSRRTLEGIELIVLPVQYANEMSYAERTFAFAKFAARASLQAVLRTADVVFATSTPLTIAIPGLLARLARRIPMVFEVRDLWPELPIAIGALTNPTAQHLARGLEWLAYHGASEIVALSPGMAEGVTKMGIPSDRVTVIPNSCDVELFTADPAAVATFRRERLPQIRADQPLVIYGGTYGHINDAGWLVDVAAAMRTLAPDVRFVMAGAGVQGDSIRSRARRLGVLDANLYMLAPLPKHEMPLLLGCATVATSLFMPLPEMWNNSANKFFDALAAAKPVAINYGGWQSALLRRGGAGITMPHGDPALAASKLAQWLGDPRGLERAAGAARGLASGTFNRDKLALQLERVLLRAIQRGHTAMAA